MSGNIKSFSSSNLSRARKIGSRGGKAILRVYRNRWFRIALIPILTIGAWYYRSEISELGNLIIDQQRFSDYVNGLGLLGPAFLWGLNVAQVIIAFIPGHVLFFSGGYIYGTVNGFLIMYTSTLVAGQAAFMLGRIFGRPMVVRFVPEKTLSVWDRISKRRGFMYYLFLLIVPIFPTDMLTYVAGLSKISILKFTIANILGRAPYIFLMTMIGALGIDYVTHSLSPTAWILLVLAIVVFIMIFRYISPRIRRDIINRQL